MKKILLFLTFLFAASGISLAQERVRARGAEAGELYSTYFWYGIYSGPLTYSTLRDAVYRLTENGKKLTIQYDVDCFIDEYTEPGSVMQPSFILADATPGVIYNYRCYEKNSCIYTQLWVSFDYGENWIFREENIGSKYYFPANAGALIYRGGVFKSNNYGQSFLLEEGASYWNPGEPGLEEEEVFSVGAMNPYQGKLTHTYDYYRTYIQIPIDSQFVYAQIWGIYPDVYRGSLPGEVYVSSMFPGVNVVNYKVSFSADTGHTFRHVYVSEKLKQGDVAPMFMSDREPGVFYIIHFYKIEDTDPWGWHTKFCVEYYRDYGETLEAIFCHDITKDYEYEEVICEHTTRLDSKMVNPNSIQLQWSPSADSSCIRGYHVYRNHTRITNPLLTGTIYLDENLPDGDYEYYVRTYYKEGCISDSSNHVAKKIEAGIKEVKNAENIVIYPNPTFTTVTVEIAGQTRNDVSKVEIYNTVGQLLQVATTKTVDVSSYNAGIYFFKVFDTENNSVTKRVVVVR